jgi:hypothetical protein
MKGKGGELKALIKQEVKVFGEARRREGTRRIKVTKYKVRKGNK